MKRFIDSVKFIAQLTVALAAIGLGVFCVGLVGKVVWKLLLTGWFIW